MTGMLTREPLITCAFIEECGSGCALRLAWPANAGTFCTHRRLAFAIVHLLPLVSAWKLAYTVCQGGKSWGRWRQVQPLRITEKMALVISRRSQRAGRPPLLTADTSGAKIVRSCRCDRWGRVRDAAHSCAIPALVRRHDPSEHHRLLLMVPLPSVYPFQTVSQTVFTPPDRMRTMLTAWHMA